MQTKSLFTEEIKSKNIVVSLEIEPKDLIINADKEQISQVLINLIKNSLQALEGKGNGKLFFRAFSQKNKIHIVLKVNGRGIPKNIINEIFVPFYTTSETGSGIGLNISKQIMKLHDGTISVSSIPGESTKFTLVFNNQ